MNNPAASRGVSKPRTTAKVCAPRGGELDPERFNSMVIRGLIYFSGVRMNINIVKRVIGVLVTAYLNAI